MFHIICNQKFDEWHCLCNFTVANFEKENFRIKKIDMQRQVRLRIRAEHKIVAQLWSTTIWGCFPPKLSHGYGCGVHFPKIVVGVGVLVAKI